MQTIPRKIHYCWFGKKEKPAIIKKCIQSWKRNLIDYEIIEWNEDNFDINSIAYVREAYKAGKYAFVSDYVRVFALYYHGGIYLDTDVEVFKPFDEYMLTQESFWGFEQGNYIATSTIGAMKGNKFIKSFLDSYETKHVYKENGSFDTLTNVAVVTKLLKRKNLLLNGEFQIIEGVGAFYPQTFFSPYDYINHRKFITNNTFTIHYFNKSWLPAMDKFKSVNKFLISRLIGGKNLDKIRKIFLKEYL